MHEIGVLPLHLVVERYDWGGYGFIPGLIGTTNRERTPCAELRMGAHPKTPATADVAAIARALVRLIAVAPDRIPGPSVRENADGIHLEVAERNYQVENHLPEVARVVKTLPPVEEHRDRGAFSIYLVNLVRLSPGRATFQPACTLQAYLEGVAVELMASSEPHLRVSS